MARSRTRRRRQAAAAVIAMVLVLAGGYAVADALDVVPGPLTTAPVVPAPTPFPTATADTAEPLVPTLDPSVAQPATDDLVAASERLVADPRTGGGVGVVITDALTGATLVDLDGSVPRTPASSIKLLVALAALDAYGPDHQLRTTVVADEPGRVVLVGGGDILLDGDGDVDGGAGGAGDDGGPARASLSDLAAQTAVEIDGPVRVVVDDSLFTGPQYTPGWGGIDFDYVMPIGPLAVGAGVGSGGGYVSDPGIAAGESFARALEAAGVEVDGEVTRGTALAGATELAVVSSAPMADVVGYMLSVSENSVAEVLGRLVALAAGEEPDHAGAARALEAQLTALGVTTEGMVLADVSGLLVENQVPTQTLAQVVTIALDPQRPQLHAAVAGLPVAALEGTLSHRMDGPAAGVLRAKTGTLTTAVSLTGLVLDAEGRLLVFALVADELPLGGVRPARAAIDEWAAAIAT